MKKLFSMLLILALVLGMAGCSGKDGGGISPSAKPEDKAQATVKGYLEACKNVSADELDKYFKEGSQALYYDELYSDITGAQQTEDEGLRKLVIHLLQYAVTAYTITSVEEEEGYYYVKADITGKNYNQILEILAAMTQEDPSAYDDYFAAVEAGEEVDINQYIYDYFDAHIDEAAQQVEDTQYSAGYAVSDVDGSWLITNVKYDSYLY